jgi:hypothetical protein
MLSFRKSMTLFVATALAITIGMAVRAHDTSNATASPLRALARPSLAHMSSPRASTYAAEVASINHEGF